MKNIDHAKHMDEFWTEMSKYNDGVDVETKAITKAPVKEDQRKGVVIGTMQK